MTTQEQNDAADTATAGADPAERMIGILNDGAIVVLGAIGHQTGLFDGDYGLTEWSQLAVTGTIWLLLPLAFGFWRVLRSEVK